MSSNNPPETEQIKPTVVRTLSPPPEIWELVHPVESLQSNSRGSFLKRYTLTAISLVLVVIVGALGAAIWTGDLRFRDVQKPTTSAKAQPLQVETTPAPIDTTPAPKDTTPVPSSTPQIDTRVTLDSTVTQPTSVSISDNSKRSTSYSIKRKTSVAAGVQPGAVSASETNTRLRTQPARQTDQQTKVAPDIDKKNSAESGTAKPKSNANVNPVLSAPPKAASTPKAKLSNGLRLIIRRLRRGHKIGRAESRRRLAGSAPAPACFESLRRGSVTTFTPKILREEPNVALDTIHLVSSLGEAMILPWIDHKLHRHLSFF